MTIVQARKTSFPPDPSPNLSLPNFILVEGTDDQKLVCRLLVDLGLDDFNVFDMGERIPDGALIFLPLLKMADSRNALLVLDWSRDADNDAAAAFESCATILAGINFPRPVAAEQICELNGKKSGVFIMPGQERPGAIEDLLLAACSGERLELARAFIEDVGAVPLEVSRDRRKGEIQAWMASLPSSPKTLAVAIRDHLIDLDDSAFDPLKAFLAALAA